MAGICLGHPPFLKKITARPKSVWLAANSAIEGAYTASHPNHKILFGSAVENWTAGPFGGGTRRGSIGTLLPRGSPDDAGDVAWADEFLNEFRGSTNQLAPDIIDFTDRVIYEIKSADFELEGQRQLTDYLKFANMVAQHLGQPGWSNLSATWKPPVILPMVGLNNANRILCTDLTDPNLSPSGVILYSVWGKEGDGDNAEAKAKTATLVIKMAPEARDMQNGITAQLRMLSLDPGQYSLLVQRSVAERVVGASRMQNTIGLLSGPSRDFLTNAVHQASLVTWLFVAVGSVTIVIGGLAYLSGKVEAGEALTAAAGITAEAVLNPGALAMVAAANDNAAKMAAAAAVLIFFSIEKDAAAQIRISGPTPGILAPLSELQPSGPFTSWQPVRFRGKNLFAMARIAALGAA